MDNGWALSTMLGDVFVHETRSEDGLRVDVVISVPASCPIPKRHHRENLLQAGVGEYLNEYRVDDYGTTIVSVSHTQEKAYLSRRS